MERDYQNWLHKKTGINQRARPNFDEREIWWCSLGANIGDEEDGKGKFFSRPVIIFKKFNSHIFLAIPLTTQIKENRYYFKFDFRNKIQCALLSQIKLIDAKRLLDRMGMLNKNEFLELKKRIVQILC